MALQAIPDQAALTRAVIVDHGDKVAVQLFGMLPHPDEDDAVADEMLTEFDVEKGLAPGALIALSALYGKIPVTHV